MRPKTWAHLLKFGFAPVPEVLHMTTLQGQAPSASTEDTPKSQSRPNTGSGLADLLLGYAQTVTLSSVGTSDLQAQNDLMYIQDDWKVTRLTLNLGLRYELYWPIIVRRTSSKFRPGPFRPRVRPSGRQPQWKVTQHDGRGPEQLRASHRIRLPRSAYRGSDGAGRLWNVLRQPGRADRRKAP